MAQQGSTGNGHDAHVNTAAASPPADVEPTKIDQSTVEKPAKSPSSTKTSARKATTKKKTASTKKAAPKKKATPKKKAVPKKKPAQARVAVAAPDSAENKNQSAPETPGDKPQLTDQVPPKVIYVKKRGPVWPWVILVVMVGVGTYLLSNGTWLSRIFGDKESTARHGGDSLETQVSPPTASFGEPSAPTTAREGIDRPKTAAPDVDQSRHGTVAPSSIGPFGGRIAEEAVMPKGTVVEPSPPETDMTRMDQDYPPLEPQQAGVGEIGSERQTTATTAAERRTATSPRSRYQDFSGRRDIPPTRAEGQVPALSREPMEADSGVTARSGEHYPPAETNKAGTRNTKEVPVASGSTAETADNSKANPEARPRANPNPPPTPPPYWNRPYRPYGPYGTDGRYQTYPPAASRPYPYGYGYANPRHEDTH
jgi:hypothetical protein